MLELQRLLDAGCDLTFQHGDGTTADGSRSYECCMITPEGNGVTAQPGDILLTAHQRAELGQGDAPKHLDGAGSEPSVEQYVDGLDGAERKVLLNHIAQAWPEVVEAGVELVAQWRAECAERRHAADKRKAKERRRRHRADARRAELGG
jgi:hypothetical protein